MRPEFDYGDQVRVLRNVRNDGTFPGLDRGQLLVRRGSVGSVRDIGTFLQDQIPGRPSLGSTGVFMSDLDGLETRAGRSCQKAWSAELQRGRQHPRE